MLVRCPGCEKMISDKARYCPICASSCPECGKRVADSAETCRYCGYDFDPVEELSLTAIAYLLGASFVIVVIVVALAC